MVELKQPNGKTKVISDEEYEKVKGTLRSTTQVRKLSSDKKQSIAPHQERQQKYGTLGSMFPYLADDYERNGDVDSFGGAVRRGIAGVKDLFSMPLRSAVGSLNQMINGENTMGKTSEEWGAGGGFLGTTAAMVTDPMAPLTVVPVGKVFEAGRVVSPMLNGEKGVMNLFNAGVRNAPKNSKLAEMGRIGGIAGGGALFGSADNAIRQEGYQTTPGVAAGVGALTAIAPYVGLRTLSYIKNKIKNIDRMTWEEFKALFNRAFRGPNAAELDDIAIMRMVSQNPEIADELARNANKPYFNAAQNEANASTSNILNNTPTPPMGEPATVQYKEFVGPKKMSATPTTREQELIARSNEVKANLKQAKKEGAAIAEEDEALLKDLQQQIKVEKNNRSNSWANGEDMFRADKKGPTVISDVRTRDYIDNVADAFDDANNKMVANWNFISDRIEQSPGWQGIRQNARGQYYAVNPERIGKIALDKIHEFQNKILGRARMKNRGTGESDPIVTNEDVANLLNELSQFNLYEHMDAVLKACTWLDEGTKRKLAENAMRNKVFGNAKLAMDKPVNRNYEKVESTLNKVEGKLNRVPGVKVVIPEPKDVKGIPTDFSKRYKSAVDGTLFRRMLDETDDRLKRPLIFAPAGISVVSGKEDK